MAKPLDELNRHTELMFLRLKKTLEGAASLFDGEFWKGMESASRIFDRKYPEKIKRQPQANEDEFFDEIFDRYTLNHTDQYFSFSWVKSYEGLQALIKPLHDDKAYKEALENLLNLEASPTNFGEKIFYISTGIRFYLELGKRSNYLYESDLPSMLKIDRALSYIREDIAAALATSDRRTDNAFRMTKGHIDVDIQSIDKKAIIVRATKKYLEDVKLPVRSFNAFLDGVREEIPKGQKPSIGTLKTFFAKNYEITKEKFDKTLRFVKNYDDFQ